MDREPSQLPELSSRVRVRGGWLEFVGHSICEKGIAWDGNDRGRAGRTGNTYCSRFVPCLFFFFKENKACLLTYCLNVCNLGQLVGHAKDSSCFMMCHHC